MRSIERNETDPMFFCPRKEWLVVFPGESPGFGVTNFFVKSLSTEFAALVGVNVRLVVRADHFEPQSPAVGLLARLRTRDQLAQNPERTSLGLGKRVKVSDQTNAALTDSTDELGPRRRRKRGGIQNRFKIAVVSRLIVGNSGRRFSEKCSDFSLQRSVDLFLKREQALMV